MGTPDFAVPCLDRIVTDGHQLLAVVTQPDRPKGRGRKCAFSPVKVAAMGHSLPVHQPDTIKDPEFVEFMQELQPDVIIVVAFGQFLPKSLLEIPPLGCINVHASLLPLYRGAAPIHWAVMNGETLTGISTMYMDVGMDSGDVILTASAAIGDDETTGELHDRLKLLGAETLHQTLDLLISGDAPRLPQNHGNATYAPLLTREHEKVDWHQTATHIHNQIRGLNPWPGAYAVYDGEPLKIWRSDTYNQSANASSGMVTRITADAIIIAAQDGQIALHEVQPASKRRMSGAEFARGYGVRVGHILT